MGILSPLSASRSRVMTTGREEEKGERVESVEEGTDFGWRGWKRMEVEFGWRRGLYSSENLFASLSECMRVHTPMESVTITVENQETDPDGGIPALHDDINDGPHHLFCQMDILRKYNDDVIWKEARRWVKFEEVWEEKGKRWSKPHVSSLYMQCLTDLHMTLVSHPCVVDVEADSMFDVVDILLDEWSEHGTLNDILCNHIRAVLLKRHKHPHVTRKHMALHARNREIVELVVPSPDKKRKRNLHSTQGTDNAGYDSDNSSEGSGSEGNNNNKSQTDLLAFGAEPNDRFKRKIPDGAEVVNIMVGVVDELRNRLCAFVRLREARDIGPITEVTLPTRFIFVMLVPRKEIDLAVEIGRCVGALMTDEIFTEIAYKFTDKVEVLSAIQDFTSHVTVLPPACWDPTIRIEPPEVLPTKEKFRQTPNTFTCENGGNGKSSEGHADPTLQRTGRLFGGLIQDIKRKAKWYKSDFTDSLHLQCVASFVYLFLATLTPNVTFGGLLGQATDQYMGTMECILAASICGVIFALFAGQPLNILGSTGPMLVLEGIIYKFCMSQHWDYMPVRLWVGLWTAFFMLVIVAFDLSALVRYITRFTEESFAFLIALIFIVKAFQKLIEIEHKMPVTFGSVDTTPKDCFCVILNTSHLHLVSNDSISATSTFDVMDTISRNLSSLRNNTSSNSSEGIMAALDYCAERGGTLLGSGCKEADYVPDVFFLSILLFLFTFGIAYGLTSFKNSHFFPQFVRQTLSDFAVLIAIVVMVLVDYLCGIPTPKLMVPSEFKPTRSDRGWFINPISPQNPWWIAIAAALPALLSMILIFMDQQITAVIVNRRENKLKKGSGYHLDMLVLAVLIVILSVLGLPWFVAATVSAIAHVMSLKKESECTAPGEKPTFLGVREQRVTALFVGILSGLAVFITSVLRHIPMPVLYGVFFYMGVSALRGMQLMQRLSILFMPQKHQPDYIYLRHVPIPRVHMFTLIQFVCLVGLWLIKSFSETSMFFPLLVLAMCFVRKGLDLVYTQYELLWIDDLLPGAMVENHSDYPPTPRNSIRKPKPYRSLSVPAYADKQPSPVRQRKHIPPVHHKTSLPFLNRSLSHEAAERKASLYEAFGPLSERKVSLMSLPTTPTYVIEGDVESGLRSRYCTDKCSTLH
ncbi:hypothetical protein FSP39_013225 [Pinctada imbricata]|uniref:Anion exchange protein n=1 Tax=Pinctada imbricata TaxID=66713 RepID=A0AA89BUS1_PINIB|nr:hypothetical protein FSP39_013225 [Pinctada imbricata]